MTDPYGNRLDGCGVCTLLPTVTGTVRAEQATCPVHGTPPYAPLRAPLASSRALPADQDTLAAELLADPRALRSYHGAAMSRALRMAYDRIPTDTEEILTWLRERGMSTTPGVGVVLAAVRAELRALAAEIAEKHRPEITRSTR